MNNFYNIDSFEEFLRESTKDFKMMPKRRVWFSIYNNLHPSKRMPSIYTTLILIITFLSLDFLNTNSFNQRNANQAKYSSLSDNIILIQNAKKEILLSVKENLLISPIKQTPKLTPHRLITTGTLNSSGFSTIKSDESTTCVNEIPVVSATYTPSKQNERLLLNGIHSKKIITTSNIVSNNFDDVFSYELYASPSFGFNHLNNNYKQDDDNFLTKNKRFKQISNLNLYAGGSVSYNISKSIRVKAGLEFNYSKSSFSDEINTAENNSLKNDNLSQSEIATNNFIQNPNLELNTYNISFPIGTDFELAGNDKIHWYAGASIEPTFKIGDDPIMNHKSELLNNDIKTRNWNLNSNIETFLSLKISKNSYFNAGPQFRYQWFSTYENLSNPNNKSYNLGMKFGVSKTF